MIDENKKKDDFSYEFVGPDIGGKHLVVKKLTINDMSSMTSAKEGLFSGMLLELWDELFKLIDLAPKELTAEDRNTLAGIFYKNFAKFQASTERDYAEFMANRIEKEWNVI